MINSSREQHGMRSTPGKTAGAIGFESASAPMLETRLGEDAPPRIPRAEEKDVIGLAVHKLFLSGAAGRSATGASRGRLSCSLCRCGGLVHSPVGRFPQLRQGVAFAVDRGFPIGEESFPWNTLRVGYPLLIGFRIAAG